MDPTTLTVRLTNAKAKPISGASIRADLVMPTMDMGRNTLDLKPTAKGVYAGTGRFTMAGSWLVNVTASKGHDEITQSFPITVR